MTVRGLEDGLRVSEATVRFGGHIAVDGISLGAPKGEITGLIGPNGAGKTTTFNCCSGLTKPTHGRVTLFGQDISRASPQSRAQLGLGRTFQRMELFDSLPVRANVALGREAGLARSRPWKHLRETRSEAQETIDATNDALEICGIDHLAHRRPAELSTGERRLVELARCIAGGFRLMLLDEPSSGLDRAETRDFAQILRRLVDQHGVGILIVEHDMSLVLSICDYLYVLDFGKMIFEGTAAEVAASNLVRAAYLGTETPELAEAIGGP